MEENMEWTRKFEYKERKHSLIQRNVISQWLRYTKGKRNTKVLSILHIK
jgi:hypothetical protein